MYRDFVNQYTHDGKANNLILVLMWREKPGQKLLNILKIHNVCTDEKSNGTDAQFVANVMEHHLKER